MLNMYLKIARQLSTGIASNTQHNKDIEII